MTQPALTEQIAHLGLQFGRLMLQNGADTDHVAADLRRFAAASGAEANLLVTYDALLVTIARDSDFRTKLGHRVPGMNVGMGALHALQSTLRLAEQGATLDRLQAELDAIEHAPPAYSHWLVVAGLALTAASLSRLFGGDWGAFVITGIAGAAETWFRLELLSFRLNAVLVIFATALLGASIGGAGAALGLTASATLCLVVPGMILVPGVPLINAIRDVLTGHATLGVSRLTFSTALLFAIAVGLLCATMITGVAIPVAAPARVIAVPQDAVFSALAALGFAILFSVPARLVWACMICGIASHTLRALLFHHGVDLIAGSLFGALAVGLLAQIFARRFTAPAVAFAFPGVVAMIPGVYAFRGVIGAVAIARDATDPALITDTLSLLFTVLLMVGAIAVGVGAPMLFIPPRR